MLLPLVRSLECLSPGSNIALRYFYLPSRWSSAVPVAAPQPIVASFLTRSTRQNRVPSFEFSVPRLPRDHQYGHEDSVIYNVALTPKTTLEPQAWGPHTCLACNGGGFRPVLALEGSGHLGRLRARTINNERLPPSSKLLLILSEPPFLHCQFNDLILDQGTEALFTKKDGRRQPIRCSL